MNPLWQLVKGNGAHSILVETCLYSAMHQCCANKHFFFPVAPLHVYLYYLKSCLWGRVHMLSSKSIFFGIVGLCVVLAASTQFWFYSRVESFCPDINLHLAPMVAGGCLASSFVRRSFFRRKFNRYKKLAQVLSGVSMAPALFRRSFCLAGRCAVSRKQAECTLPP